MTPKAHKSAPYSAGWSEITSGDTYSAVPTNVLFLLGFLFLIFLSLLKYKSLISLSSLSSPSLSSSSSLSGLTINLVPLISSVSLSIS